MKCFYSYRQIIQQEATKNTQKMQKLRKKAQLLHERENQICEELENLHHQYIPEINFMNEIISRHHLLINQRKEQHQALLTHER